jgi:uncharacterized protein YjiS (DUF1127 family)
MTTITLSSRPQQNGNFFEGLRKTAVAFIEGVTEGLDMAQQYRTLSRMSEDDLRKHGLTRSEVSRAIALGRQA